MAKRYVTVIVTNSSGYPQSGVKVVTDRMNDPVWTDSEGKAGLTLDGYTYLYIDGTERWKGYEYEFGGSDGEMVFKK